MFEPLSGSSALRQRQLCSLRGRPGFRAVLPFVLLAFAAVCSSAAKVSYDAFMPVNQLLSTSNTVLLPAGAVELLPAEEAPISPSPISHMAPNLPTKVPAPNTDPHSSIPAADRAADAVGPSSPGSPLPQIYRAVGRGSIVPGSFTIGGDNWNPATTPSDSVRPAPALQPPPLPPAAPPLAQLPADTPFTMLHWSSITGKLRLLKGQELRLESLVLELSAFADPLGSPNSLSLDTLAPTPLFDLPAGATLRLLEVAFVLSSEGMSKLYSALCSRAPEWPYNLGVSLQAGELLITNLTTRVPGSGGTVIWSGVRIIRMQDTQSLMQACTVSPVNSVGDLMVLSGILLQQTRGSLVAYLSDDTAVPTVVYLDKLSLDPATTMVLRGNPAQPTTLDLQGVANLWASTLAVAATTETLWAPKLAVLHDLVLVNLPWPSKPNGPMSLMASAVSSFEIIRGLFSPGDVQLELVNCTLVVPDEEVAFLAQAAHRSASEVWPGAPMEGFSLQLRQLSQNSLPLLGGADAAPKLQRPSILAVSKMMMLSEVLLTDCTLICASHYASLPDAVPLLPRSLEWVPQMLGEADPDTYHVWGPGGMSTVLGMRQALSYLDTCGENSIYNPTRLIWRRYDNSLPELHDSTTLSPQSSESLSGAPSATSTVRCGVAGVPSQVAGGRVFVDLKGGMRRFDLVRPVTLRNLVLYNLAPGGVYPEGFEYSNISMELQDQDAAWKNSSLPLWFFNMPRFLAGSSSSSFLFLDNVTLVVPEGEWRALVAALVLTQESPEPMPASGTGTQSAEMQQATREAAAGFQPGSPSQPAGLQLGDELPEESRQGDEAQSTDDKGLLGPDAGGIPDHARSMLAESGPASPPKGPIDRDLSRGTEAPTDARASSSLRATAGNIGPGTPEHVSLAAAGAGSTSAVDSTVQGQGTMLLPIDSATTPLAADVGHNTAEPAGAGVDPADAAATVLDEVDVLGAVLSTDVQPKQVLTSALPGHTLDNVNLDADGNTVGVHELMQPGHAQDAGTSGTPTGSTGRGSGSTAAGGTDPALDSSAATEIVVQEPGLVLMPLNPVTIDPGSVQLYNGTQAGPGVGVSDHVSIDAGGGIVVQSGAGDSPLLDTGSPAPEPPAAPFTGVTGLGQIAGGINIPDSTTDNAGEGMDWGGRNIVIEGAKSPPPSMPLTPPSPEPTPPSLPDKPSTPPSPPFPPLPIDAATTGLMAFAAVSKVLHYDYSSGTLVLATAVHYGWTGSRVTLTHRLPEDAPEGASLLSYPDLDLPYGMLADLPIVSSASFPDNGLAPDAAVSPDPQPPISQFDSEVRSDTSDSMPSTSTGGDNAVFSGSLVTPPAPITPQPPTAAPPALLAPSHSSPLDTPSSSLTLDTLVPSSSPSTSTSPSPGPPSWVIPVAATVGSLLTVATCVLLILTVILFRQRRNRRRSASGYMEAAAAKSSPSLVESQNSAKVLPWLSQAAKHSWGAAGKVMALRIGSSVVDVRSGSPLGFQGLDGGGSVQQATEEPAAGVGRAVSSIVSRVQSTSIAGDLGGAAATSEVRVVPKAVSNSTAALTAGRDDNAEGLLTAAISTQDAETPLADTTSSLANRAALAEALAHAVATAYGQELQEAGAANGHHLFWPPSAALSWSTSADGVVDFRGLAEEAFARDVMVYFEPRDLSSDGALQDAENIRTIGSIRGRSPSNCPPKHQHMESAIVALQAELGGADELRVDAAMGHGAFGVVYRGTWRGLSVAIKTLVVLPEGTEGGDGRSVQRHRAVMEAAISMSLSHPHVVVTYTYDLKPLIQQPPVCQSGGPGTSTPTIGIEVAENCDAFKLYIVQEYCNGGSLRHALEQGVAGSVRGGGLPRRLALRLALDVALGMAHIHNQRIVHGDLKPENVLLVLGPRADQQDGCEGGAPTQNGLFGSHGVARLTAKVADFGLSQPLAEGATHASKHFQGTPAYTAPEVLEAGQLSPHADVWSFGLLLLELYYGCTLAQAGDVYAAVARPQGQQQQQQLQHPPVHAVILQELLSHCPCDDRHYASTAASCLAPHPRQRPDFAELATSLKSMIGVCSE